MSEFLYSVLYFEAVGGAYAVRAPARRVAAIIERRPHPSVADLA
jgi:hypothetical protein